MQVSDFRGVNWAYARDNFVDGWIIPSGIYHQLSQELILEQARHYLQ
jgi:hypothetical protein